MLKSDLVLFPLMAITLMFAGCVDVSAEQAEQPTEVNFIDELAKKIEGYDAEKRVSLDMLWDEIAAIKDTIWQTDVLSAITPEGGFERQDVHASYFILSIHESALELRLDSRKLGLQNTYASPARKISFDPMPTQAERDIEHFYELLHDAEINEREAEQNWDSFDVYAERLDRYFAAKYVIVIKDLLNITADFPMYSEDYSPGEVISAVFLYERASGEILDVFTVNTLNKSHVTIEDTGDPERNQEKLKYRLETALRSDYNKALKERLKVRYAMTQESLFF